MQEWTTTAWAVVMAINEPDIDTEQQYERHIHEHTLRWRANWLLLCRFRIDRLLVIYTQQHVIDSENCAQLQANGSVISIYRMIQQRVCQTIYRNIGFDRIKTRIRKMFIHSVFACNGRRNTYYIYGYCHPVHSSFVCLSKIFSNNMSTNHAQL